MLNRKLIAKELRRIADKVDKNKITIDLGEGKSTYENIKNFNGEVTIILDDDRICKFNATGFGYFKELDNLCFFNGKTIESNSDFDGGEEIGFYGFSSINVKSFEHSYIYNSENITSLFNESGASSFKNCKNIHLESISSVSFTNCENIKIDNTSKASNVAYFKNCSNIEFGFEAPEGNNYDITFENCSGCLKTPGDFWAVYKNCKFKGDEEEDVEVNDFNSFLKKGLEEFKYFKNLNKNEKDVSFYGVIFPIQDWKRLHNTILQAICNSINSFYKENGSDEVVIPENLMDEAWINDHIEYGQKAFSENISPSDKYVISDDAEFPYFIGFSNAQDIINKTENPNIESEEDLKYLV